ncbi:SDR family oxidoreductase [Galactobacter valiniphilus]|uniref:SDR family oxidoreductase n=1 Tax=Galactobacter valiniphilus TaxID=2676122 RepID=UPI003735FCCB
MNTKTKHQDAEHAHQGRAPRYPQISPRPQQQPEPGLDGRLRPLADHGEQSYVGTGRLRGKRVLITGADSGIGAAVAIAFYREGAQVALSYLPVEEPDVDALAAALAGSPGEDPPGFYRVPGDLLDRSYRDGLVGAAKDLLGGLDILINNAGKQRSVAEIKDLTDEQIEATFGVNVFAMFALSRDAVAHLGPGSSIINTASVQAYSPSGHLLDYAATKAAINAFTKGLAEQLGPRGIRVNAVAPGPIWTPLQPSGGQPAEALPTFGHDTWLGRAGQPAELASAFVFLAEDSSSYVTGSTVHVNGGKPSP